MNTSRSDLGKNIKFVGTLLPYTAAKKQQAWNNEKLKRYKKVVLVTQGTVEKDVNKILIPTLEAFKNSDTLVIATTSGTGTAELQKKYPFDNIIIEDYIPFNDVMPLCQCIHYKWWLWRCDAWNTESRTDGGSRCA